MRDSLLLQGLCGTACCCKACEGQLVVARLVRDSLLLQGNRTTLSPTVDELHRRNMTISVGCYREGVGWWGGRGTVYLGACEGQPAVARQQNDSVSHCG